MTLELFYFADHVFCCLSSGTPPSSQSYEHLPSMCSDLTKYPDLTDSKVASIKLIVPLNHKLKHVLVQMVHVYDLKV